MFDRSTKAILTLAVLAAIIGGVMQHRQQSPASAHGDPAIIGKLAPALALSDLQGRTHSLTDYRGRRVLVNFWASWCGPCLQEMPALDQAQQKFGDHGAIVLGIAMDEPDRVRTFMATHPVSYPIFIGQLEAPSTSMKLGDTGEILPFSVLIDADGYIIATHAGILSSAQLDDWLAPAQTSP